MTLPSRSPYAILSTSGRNALEPVKGIDTIFVHNLTSFYERRNALEPVKGIDTRLMVVVGSI